ncbi:MAG TPA: hypothetical protein VHQ94_00660, partial [Pyrinomonadaceae bacterium]|nr:hypothetical protein [Pyrinomonadaceae bacterium]
MNADGTNKRQLNFNGQDTGNLALSWSPDSQRIVFQVMDGPGMPSMEIYIVNVDGTGLTRLTNDNFEDIHPQWSPDGTKIAFLSRRGDTNHDVYTMNTDGSNIQRLTFFGAPGASNGTGPPRWSPDGTRIAFQRGLTRNVQGVNTSFGQLMVMDASGGGQTVLHEVKNASFDFPFWSHDGSRISASVGGELYTVSAGGGASFVAYNNTHVPHSWSPDDSRVVYADKGSLYVSSDEDPGTRTKIDTGIFNAMDQFGAPTWKPRAPCNCPTISSPGLQFVQSHWPDSRTNWAMIAEVTAQDGLVLKDVMLGERYLAKKITVPYYNLQTSAYSGRGELKPDSIEGDGTRRTRLVEYNVFEHSEKLVVEAVYAIDKIPAASTSCLFVTQRYEFFRQGVGGRCEPSGTLNCSRFQPKVSYRFFGQSGESLVSLNIPQLRHFQIDQNAKNSAGLFKDCEFDPLPCVPLPADSLPGTFGFERKENPLWDEWYGDVVTNGKSLGVWDNIHTTQFDRVSEPVFCLTCVPDTVFVGAGCPECMHSHWRWSASASDFEQFNHGNLINWPPGSNQDFSFAVVKYRDIEEHPTDFTTLANSERIRTSNTIYTPNLHRYEFSHPDEIAVWYSSTGHRSHDIFYGFGLFFSGAQQSVQINGPMEPQELGLDRRVVYANSELVVDELTSVVVGNLYAEGETTLTPFNPNVVGPLPAGYVVLNNLVINVETEAETSGPNLITFTVPSATDPAVFDSLRIFHAETDPFAPNQTIWVDRTVLAPDSPAPDFISKTITARTRVLGGFAVAALGTPQPTPGNAGIAITAGHTPSQIVAGNDATYTFTVTNAGPDSANGVRLEAQLPPNSVVHTVTPSQGICSFEEGPVRCKLDTLANSGSANVIVVARMRQGG